MVNKLDKTYIFQKFNGLNALFQKSANDIKVLQANRDYSEEYKAKQIQEIRDKLFNTYGDMLSKGIQACDTCVKDKMEGYKVCNIPNLNDEQRLYYLNFYTNVVEKLGGVNKVMDFMENIENLNNEVYREIFLLKVDMYKDDAAKLGLNEFARIDNIEKTIKGEYLDGVEEYNDIRANLERIITGVPSQQVIFYNLENGDYIHLEYFDSLVQK